MAPEHHIAILDFGSQYTHLIARRVRELGVQSMIYPTDVPAEALEHATGIILSGGPRSLVKDPQLAYDPRLFDLGKPILGLCYGHQLMADHFGGTVVSGTAREYGIAELQIEQSPIFHEVDIKTTVWMSHGDHVDELPEGFTEIATSGNGSITAMANHIRRFYGFQFHPEVHHSQQGMRMLENFIFNICRAEKNWSTANQLSHIQEQIKAEAGDKNVFLLISGGVDSTVSFALLEKTLGKDRVYGLHVDHGLMRKDESKKVKEALKAIGLDDLHVYNAEAEYLKALQGIVDPETKRKIIGDLFIDIANRVMSKLKMDDGNWLLGQGTIYPDTIESGGTKHADKIKTHHNRVDRIQEMIIEGLVIEPIKDLYKDEVREIGRALGLPHHLVDRHPFPGPGLAIRCLCSEESDEVGSVIVSPKRSEGRNNPVTLGNQKIASVTSFPRNDTTIVRLPMKSVGVQGDERSYAHPAVILTDHYHWDCLAKQSPQITNTYKDVNRVLALLSGRKERLPQSTMHAASVTTHRMDLLRDIDALVNEIAQTDPNYTTIWQMPIVLVPFGHDKKESVVLRPVESNEAMTVSFGRLTQQTIDTIISHPTIIDNVDFVFYDVTNKPPGTIEWE